jgi:SAM-dependent methyltransferase
MQDFYETARARNFIRMSLSQQPYDNIAGHFDAARVALQPKELEYLDLVLDSLEPHSTILDLGCGTGRPIATHLASRGHHIVGVDGSAAMLALARLRLPEHRWIHGLIERVQLEEMFDAVICWDSLFHMPREHWAPIIRRIRDWLKPGGCLMLSSGGTVEGDHGFYDTMFGHEFYYDSLPPSTLARLIDEIGFHTILSELCDVPDGARNRGKWATIALRT